MVNNNVLKFKNIFIFLGIYASLLWTSLATAESTLEMTELSDNLLLIQGAGANIVVADGPQGLVIVDGGLEKNANAVLEILIKRFGVRPVLALFNTHWHSSQTGLNARLGEQGVAIIAHENTKQWLGVEVTVKWSGLNYAPLPPHARPSQSFYDKGSLRLGERTIEYAYLPQAHTDGDIYVYFPEDDVLVAGGVFASDRWPVIDWWTGGWYSGMIDGLTALLAVAGDDTVIIPAHGNPVDREWLQREYEMHENLFQRIYGLLQKSQSPAETVAAHPTGDLHPQWDNRDEFVENAFRSLYGHLRGEKRMGNMP